MHSRTLDHPAADWMRGRSQAWMRASLGLVYIWFGAPKLVSGLSPAEDLVRATVPWFDPAWFVPALGIGEVLIGLCLWRARWLRLGLVLMGLHMVGTALPLVTLPELTWRSFPVLTLEGQYILKNTVLIAGALALAGARSGSRRSARRAPLATGPGSRTMGRARLRPIGPRPTGQSATAPTTAATCKPRTPQSCQPRSTRLNPCSTGSAAGGRRIAVSLRA